MTTDDGKGVSLPQFSKDYDEQRPEILTTKERLSSAFTIACSGFALISDGLQNNIMSLTNVVFAQLYGSAYTSHWSTQLSNSLTVGTIFGQIIIGYLCDVKGRKWGIVLSTVMIVIGIILCAASHGANGSFIGFLWMFTVCRGITGIGLGGEYPSCSTSAAEAANEKIRKQRGPVFIMVTNFMLSFGTPFACILYLIVFEAAGGLDANLSTVWRTVFGISCIPPLAVFYFRLKMLNSQLYRKGAIQHNVPHLLTIRYYWKSLIGTAGAWFLYDFITFPNGVFSGQIISSVVSVKGKALVRKTAEYQLLLGAIALPGCVVGALLVNRLGRRNTMILGFSGYLIFGLAVGCAYDRVIKNVPGFIVLYGLMNSFANAGPGDMLGLTSSESYATAVRGTCYGFSAAIGKVGAVVGTQAFTPIQHNLGKRWTFIIAAICGLAGMTVTWFFIRNDLDRDLAMEDANFQAFLEANGWHGDVGAAESVDALVASEKGEVSKELMVS
ncbi:MFS Git1p-like glycerophosphoinositol permease [Guyanagaster necrorhizus]|uniref:MFS Git1p-like glycerophosphoinositol permease n=1 Tax=Guyanagaster necrorhizus TaxID=856835 RepID=A0A9P7VQQ7_9AGAR|nr:MFS Git1p-like glycerophosphoinositol permease [Guyanagaster necrorhizus MCA 3950]KAG7445067.1 MFS Git1p-like glycerophosphoinositol permease [Guyanagaster necrorhizus MCA 3950]